MIITEYYRKNDKYVCDMLYERPSYYIIHINAPLAQTAIHTLANFYLACIIYNIQDAQKRYTNVWTLIKMYR